MLALNHAVRSDTTHRPSLEAIYEKSCVTKNPHAIPTARRTSTSHRPSDDDHVYRGLSSVSHPPHPHRPPSPPLQVAGTLHTALRMSLRDNFRTKRRELKALLLPSPSPDPQARIASSSTNTKKTILAAIRISLELTEKLSEELPPLQMTVKVLGTVLDMYQVCPTVSRSIVCSNVPGCPFVCGL